MRVRHLPDIPSVMRLSEVISLELIVPGDDDDLSFGDVLPAPEPAEDLNAVTGSTIFAALSPGEERTVVILKAEGYNHDSISYITGLSETQIRRVMSQVRSRTAPTLHPVLGVGIETTPPYRAWNTASHVMRFVRDPKTLSPKHDYRVMRPTACSDTTGRRIYEWDILERAGQLAIVSYWRNQKASGYRPDASFMHSARIVGNIWEHPHLAARARRQRQVSTRGIDRHPLH